MKDTRPNSGRESASADPGHAAVEQILKSLTKLVSGRKIYAENNPRLEQFRNELTVALRGFFERRDELVLHIDQYTIGWNEQVVYENTRREESIAFILFKDGIGEVTILPAAVSTEVGVLVDILASELHNREQDDDVVTRFWNADFEHITYRVLDDYLAGEYGKGSAGDGDDLRQDETSDHPELLPSLADRGRVVVEQSNTLQSIDAFLRATLASHHPEGDDRQREALYQRMLRTNFAVPAEELSIYERELERERNEDGLALFVEAIIVFALLPDNPSGARDIMAVVDRLVDYAIDEKTPATLARLAAFLRDFRTTSQPPDNIVLWLDRLVGRITHPAILSALMERIDRPGPYTDATLRYATAMGAAAVEPLTRALHRIEGNPVHRQICDALIAVAGDQIAATLDSFDIDRPPVAVDAVYIARALELPLSARLRELAFYPDARVKLEMIDWIARRDDAEAQELLLQSLADLDKRIRLRVLEALTGRVSPLVRARVSDIAFGKDFNERAADEQEAFFRTLGSVGDIHTVDQIRSMIERRKRIGAGKGVDAKLLAIRALEKIHHPSALDILNRLVDDTNEAVRLRAARASETLAAAIAAPTAGVES
ncbi:MAG TPA: HEAT repeat domain-containing protein [Candidatus Krumholzibacteria bacterium]|nr:HEAT repeat domain-containing protein [Candidatus Krumholzibacteria bacterium]